MPFLRKAGNKPLFIRIIILFVLIILPLYLFYVLTNIMGQKDILRQTMELNESKIDYYISAMEREFDKILVTQRKFVDDEDLIFLSRMDRYEESYDKYDTINRVRRKLDSLRESSRFIKDVSAYVPNIGLKISTSCNDEIRQEEYLDLKRAAMNDSYPFYPFQGEYVSIISYDTYFDGNSDMNSTSFVVSIQISREGMEGLLKQVKGRMQGGVMIIGDRNGLDAVEGRQQIFIPAIRKAIWHNSSGNPVKVDSITATIGKDKCLVQFKYMKLIHSSLVVFVPNGKLPASLAVYKAALWGITLLTLLMGVLFALRIRKMITYPLDRLKEAFNCVEDGNLNMNLEYTVEDEFGYIYKHFNNMCKKLLNLIEQVYEQKLLTRNAELKQLQYQINPHFLYNCIFFIYRMAKLNDSENIIRLTGHLGNYYQFVARHTGDTVPLVREMEHAQDYIGVQMMRFSNRISVEIRKLPPEFENLVVPRLIVQPLVENAYMHGLKRKETDGKIVVGFQTTGKFFTIFVEDNGEETDNARLEVLKVKLAQKDMNVECTGLLNVHRRLVILYGEESGVAVMRGGMSGLRVEIRIGLEGVTDGVQLAGSG
jgi:two-component system, sensor histidine kinase YesM